jgi:hypothetical protein
MKKLLLVVLTCLFALSINAQDSTSYNLLSLKFSPLALFNVQTACIQQGLELRFLPKWGIQAEYGFQFEKYSLLDWNWKRQDWKYHKWKTELRHYLPLGKKMEAFAGLEYFEVQQQYRKKNDIVTLSDGILYRYDQSDIRRNSWGLLGKYGFTLWHSNHFFTELDMGAGFKKVTISHDLSNPVVAVDYKSMF